MEEGFYVKPPSPPGELELWTSSPPSATLGQMIRVALVMALCNGPVAAVLALDIWGGGHSEEKAEKALELGRCQARAAWLPGACNQPVAARLDVFEGYEYRFFKCLCAEHATDAARKLKGAAYKVDWLVDEAA
jgi:hypothetical protein